MARERTSPSCSNAGSCSSVRIRRTSSSWPRVSSNVGDSSLGDGAGAQVAELLEDGQLFRGPDSEGLIEFPAVLQDVGDLALGDGAQAHIAELGRRWGARLPFGFSMPPRTCPRICRMPAMRPRVIARRLRSSSISECLLRTRVGGLRLRYVAERLLKIAQVQQQVHIAWAQRRLVVQVRRQPLDARLSVGGVHDWTHRDRAAAGPRGRR